MTAHVLGNQTATWLKMFETKKFFFCVFITTWIGYCAADCTWKVSSLPAKDPIIYQTQGRRGRLMVPLSQEGFKFKKNITVKVYCPGTGNYLKKLGLDEADITCRSRNTFATNGLELSLSDLECAKASTGDVRRTNKTCFANRGTILSAGFDSPDGWIQLYEICYDLSNSTPLYAHHTVYGTAIAGAFVGNDRPSFRTNGLPSNVSINSALKKTTQTTRFKTLLGESQANRYLTDYYLSRGHLAPDADFILHSWQRNTYFYANVVPQWMNINAGNWRKVENSVRESAKNKSEVLKVWTGTADVLKLKDVNDNDVKMYLGKRDRIPIPKYIWKLVCNASQQCIVFVVNNNPFDSDNVCESVCRETGWYKEGFENVQKGHTLCCDVRSLNGSLALPNVVNAKNVLLTF